MKPLVFLLLTLCPMLASSQFNGTTWSAWEDCADPARSILSGLKEPDKIKSVTLRIYAANCGTVNTGCNSDQEENWSGHKLETRFEEYIWHFDENNSVVFYSECLSCDTTPLNNKYKIVYTTYNEAGLRIQTLSKDSVPESGISKVRSSAMTYDAGGRLVTEVRRVEGASEYKYRFQYPDATSSHTYFTQGRQAEYLENQSTLDSKGRVVREKIFRSPEDKAHLAGQSWFHPETCTMTEYHDNGKIRSIRTNYCGKDSLTDKYLFEFDTLGRLIRIDGLASLTAEYEGDSPWVASYTKTSNGLRVVTRLIREMDEKGNPRIIYLTNQQIPGAGTPFPVLSRKYVFDIQYRD